MVSIEWAKANCSVNLERLSRIKDDEEWLEKEIDRNICFACKQGKRRLVISTRIPNRGFAEDEAVTHILEKYRDNGYDAILRDGYDVNAIVISW